VDPTQRTAAIAHYDELARLGRALSNPLRLRLLDLLRQGPRSVEVLAAAAGGSVANVSQHLQQLRGARLVASDKHGQHVEYRLADEQVDAVFVALRSLGERVLPEFDRLQQTLQVSSSERRDALLKRVASGEVTLLDVRPTEEWRGGHLLDAMHIPLPELPTRLLELPKRRPVVAYCRGPYCPLALSAVDVLRSAGFDADHLDLGPADLARGTALARRLVVQAARRDARDARDARAAPNVPQALRGTKKSADAAVPHAPAPRAKTRAGARKKNTSRRSPA
jgi:rhodanese-related sulfurtransferase/DNA-binding transcriptional ArsR family regulator